MAVHICGECGNTTDDHNPNDLTVLPEQYRMPADHDLLRDDLASIITTAIKGHPRSQQTRPGPSELGSPCQRKLAYKLLGIPFVNTEKEVGWKPTVGTAIHTWLEEAFTGYNDSHKADRFYLEQKVTVGDLAGAPLRGTADVYDRATATVIDWKTTGPSTLKAYRINGPGEQYRRQAHLYGRGFALLGLPVERVAICFLPRNGELRDLHLWSEPYDEALALDTLARAEGIAQLVHATGPQMLPLLPTAESSCTFCPWYSPAASDATEACAGHKDPAVQSSTAA